VCYHVLNALYRSQCRVPADTEGPARPQPRQTPFTNTIDLNVRITANQHRGTQNDILQARAGTQVGPISHG